MTRRYDLELRQGQFSRASFVAEQLLHGADVPSPSLTCACATGAGRVNSTVLEQVGGEGVAIAHGIPVRVEQFFSLTLRGDLRGGWILSDV